MYIQPSRRQRLAAQVLFLIVVGLAASADAQAPEHFDQAWQSGVPAIVSGVVSARVVDDFQRRQSTITFQIEDERTGRSHLLRFATAAPKLRPGTRARVVGRMLDSALYVACCETSGGGSADSGITVLSSADPIVVGDQKTILIIVNFIDKSTRVTASDLDVVMFTGGPNPGRSVDGIYRESSFGNVSFSGTVVGPYTIGASASDPCEPDKWWVPANAGASAGGVDLNAYARRVYVMPGNANCGFGGLSDMGVTPSRSFVFADNADYGLPVDLFAHELGHALGMHHATTPGNEYGDISDVMGNGGYDLPRQNNAPHKMQMGWIPATQTSTITRSGSYTIASLETDPAGATMPQVLLIRKVDTNEFYYVSYRVGTGFDAQLSCCGYLDRLSVHRWNAASVNIEKTILVGVVTDSGSFTDVANGITVTLTSRTSTGATVQVQMPESVCNPAPPSVTLTPPSQSGPPGTAVGYDVAVVNNDAPGCGSTGFSLGGITPPGWIGSLSQANLQLAPGSTGRATLTVTPPSTTPSGTYLSSINVGDGSVPVHAASVTASLNVIPLCLAAPTVEVSPSTQSAVAGSTLTYTVRVANNDRAGCPSTNFTLNSSGLAEWSVSPSSSTMTLSAGGFGVVTVSVRSPLTSPVDAYTISHTVSDGSNPLHDGSAASVYDVQGDSTAPTAPAGLVATVKRRQVNLTWQNSSDNVGVAGYHVIRDGAVIGTTTSASWVDGTAGTSAYTYTVVAYDRAGNLSTPSNAAIVRLGGKGK